MLNIPRRTVSTLFTIGNKCITQCVIFNILKLYCLMVFYEFLLALLAALLCCFLYAAVVVVC